MIGHRWWYQIKQRYDKLVGCGHLDTAPPFSVPFPPEIEPRAVAWQSITLPLPHASPPPPREKRYERIISI